MVWAMCWWPTYDPRLDGQGHPASGGLCGHRRNTAHCRTPLTDTAVTSHVRITEPSEAGEPTAVPREAGVRPAKEGGLLTALFFPPYIRRMCLMMLLVARVQHEQNDRSCLTASTSLVSDHAETVYHTRITEPWNVGGTHPRSA